MSENKKPGLFIPNIDNELARKKAFIDSLGELTRKDQKKKIEDIEKLAQYKAEAIARQEYERIRAELIKEANLSVEDKNALAFRELAKAITKE